MPSNPRLQALLDQREAFLRFLDKRVGTRATSEDILQEALVRSMDRLDEIRQDDALVGWFYKVLENAALDHHRRSSTAGKALGRLGDEVGGAVAEIDDAPARTCKCVHKVKAQLKPEYQQALDRIEVDEVAVKDFADEAGITRSNAAVRVFRAREALRQGVKTTCGHCAALGCTDCSCVTA